MRLKGLWLATVILGFSSLMSAAAAETVAIIGTGRMGGAFGPQFARLGLTVIYGSRDPARPELQALLARTGKSARALSPAEAVRQADYVVLALPWSATEAVVKNLDLSGKIVIDPINALQPGTSGNMEMAVETSAAEWLQTWAPRARIVKAFNTVGFHVIVNPAAAGGPVTVPLASDDIEAKRRVSLLVERMGFETLDVGRLRHSRVLESMTILYMVPYMSGRRAEAFEYYFRKGAAPKQSQGVRPAQ